MASSKVKLENEAAQSTNALGPLIGGGLHLVLSFQGVTIAVAALVAAGTAVIALMLPARGR